MKEKLTKVESMFRKDALVLSVFIAFTAIIMIFVALQIVGMGGEGALEYVPAIIACISIVAMAWAVIEVLKHLKRNKQQIYEEDLMFQALIKEQKQEESCEEK